MNLQLLQSFIYKKQKRLLTNMKDVFYNTCLVRCENSAKCTKPQISSVVSAKINFTQISAISFTSNIFFSSHLSSSTELINELITS